jgi:hypothetical protein
LERKQIEDTKKNYWSDTIGKRKIMTA